MFGGIVQDRTEEHLAPDFSVDFILIGSIRCERLMPAPKNL